MHKIEQTILNVIGLGMGLWFIVGCLGSLLFIPEHFGKILHLTISIYVLLFFVILCVFLIKKAFSVLINAGLEPKEKEKRKK